MATIRDFFASMKGELDLSQAETEVTPANVYQKADAGTRQLIMRESEKLLLPGSEMLGAENLAELKKLSEEGKSCLILVEHFSNLDLPNLFLVAEKSPLLGREFTDMIISMAGVKLNEENPYISALVHAFDRLVVYPSRSLNAISDPEEWKEVRKKSLALNKASLYEMTRAKHNGRIILVFPSGTRYRPWDPDSGKALKEMSSYLKAFDYGCFISINGNTLRMQENGSMLDDILIPDVILCKASPVFKTADFRQKHLEEAMGEGDQKKQYVADQIMENLTRLHNETEPLYKERVNAVKTNS